MSVCIVNVTHAISPIIILSVMNGVEAVKTAELLSQPFVPDNNYNTN